MVLFSAGAPLAACVFSEPPQPVCGKSLHVAAAAPETLLLPEGGSFDLATQVYFTLLDFPMGLGSCPAGPYSVDIEVDLICGADLKAAAGEREPRSGGGGSLSGAPISLGFNELAVPVSVASGAPRRCQVDVEARVTLADGMTLTASSDTVACLAEPITTEVQRPRLGLKLVEIDVAAIARAHAGEQLSRIYRVTNNDPLQIFDGILMAESSNVARLPGFSGPMPVGTGVFSLSDPVQGDNFPIAFPGLLYQGRVPLPRDSTNPERPTIEVPLSLAPQESVDIEIFSRSWGVCADGATSRAVVEILGAFEDATRAEACAGFTHGVDTMIEPTFSFDDSGEVAEAIAADLDRIRLKGKPRPQEEREIEIDPSTFTLLSNAELQPLTPIGFSDILTANLGRSQIQLIPDEALEVDALFELRFDLSITGTSFEVAVDSFGPLHGAPTGLDRISPVGTGLLKLSNRGKIDSFIELLYQLQVVGIDDLGARRPILWQGVELKKLPDDSGIGVGLIGGVAGPGAGTRLDALELANDFRGFHSTDPEERLGEIFTDGFEAGNVTRWSNSVP